MLLIENEINLKNINNVIFGGAGFIGSSLIDKLLESGQNVVCIDNLFSGSLSNLIHLKNNKKFFFIKHNILDLITCKIPIDRIWHLACPASPNLYQKDPLLTIRINYEGTLNILNLAREYDSKILFTSTSEIYGMTNCIPQSEEIPISLKTYSPRACYSEGKRIAETLLSTYSIINSMDIKIARIFNTYGPRLKENDGRVISTFLYQAFHKKSLTIYGDGSQTRSFCYISDLIDGLIKLMNSNYKKPINLGNDEEITILQLAKLIRKKVNPYLDLDFKKLPIDDPKYRKPCIKLAKEHLDWEPIINLEEGLDNFIEFYKRNKNSK